MKSLFSKRFRDGIVKYTPEILTGLGLAGMATSVIMAVHATPKALTLIEEYKDEIDEDVLTKKEVVKATWKCYVPAAFTFVASSACIIGANKVHATRNAMLATACAIAHNSLVTYSEKVIETIGEEKEREIRSKVAKEEIDRNPTRGKEIIITNSGETLCFDVLSGRYFKSNMEEIRKVVNNINKRLMSEMYISLNELYYELDIPGIATGDYLGWNVEDGLIEVIFDSQISDDGKPCIVIDYLVQPRIDFQKFA